MICLEIGKLKTDKDKIIKLVESNSYSNFLNTTVNIQDLSKLNAMIYEFYGDILKRILKDYNKFTNSNWYDFHNLIQFFYYKSNRETECNLTSLNPNIYYYNFSQTEDIFYQFFCLFERISENLDQHQSINKLEYIISDILYLVKVLYSETEMYLEYSWQKNRLLELTEIYFGNNINDRNC